MDILHIISLFPHFLIYYSWYMLIHATRYCISKTHCGEQKCHSITRSCEHFLLVIFFWKIYTEPEQAEICHVFPSLFYWRTGQNCVYMFWSHKIILKSFERIGCFSFVKSKDDQAGLLFHKVTCMLLPWEVLFISFISYHITINS